MIIRPTYYAALGSATLTGIGLIYFFAAPITQQLHRWQLLPEPERFTQVYFTNPAQLPRTFEPDGKQTVQFTIRNLEHATKQYTYRVTVRSNVGAHVATTGSLLLAQGQQRSLVKEVVMPSVEAQRVFVSVQVQQARSDPSHLQTETIHYITTNKSLASKERGTQ